MRIHFFTALFLSPFPRLEAKNKRKRGYFLLCSKNQLFNMKLPRAVPIRRGPIALIDPLTDLPCGQKILSQP